MREFSGDLGLATLVFIFLGLRGAPHFVPHFRGGLGQIYFSARLIDRMQTRCYYFDVCEQERGRASYYYTLRGSEMLRGLDRCMCN